MSSPKAAVPQSELGLSKAAFWKGSVSLTPGTGILFARVQDRFIIIKVSCKVFTVEFLKATKNCLRLSVATPQNENYRLFTVKST